MNVNDGRIISSKSLKEEAEREYGKSIIESNGGSTRYSSRDNTYSNLFDFFIKVGKANTDKGETGWGRLSVKEKVTASLAAAAVLITVIGFVALATYLGGRIGLLTSLMIAFATWMFTRNSINKRRRR